MLGIKNMREMCFQNTVVNKKKRLVKALFFVWLTCLHNKQTPASLEKQGFVDGLTFPTGEGFTRSQLAANGRG